MSARETLTQWPQAGRARARHYGRVTRFPPRSLAPTGARATPSMLLPLLLLRPPPLSDLSATPFYVYGSILLRNQLINTSRQGARHRAGSRARTRPPSTTDTLTREKGMDICRGWVNFNVEPKLEFPIISVEFIATLIRVISIAVFVCYMKEYYQR